MTWGKSPREDKIHDPRVLAIRKGYDQIAHESSKSSPNLGTIYTIMKNIEGLEKQLGR